MFLFRTFDLNGSGKPWYGSPIPPCKNSMTDLGKLNSSALANTSSADNLFCTIN